MFLGLTSRASTLDGPSHAFLYSGGTMADLGTLGGSNSLACAINAAGLVVGYSSVAGDVTSDAFVYSDGRMADLNDLIDPASGWRLYPTGSVTDPQGATSGTDRVLRGGSSTTT